MPRYNLDITDTSGTGATPLGLARWVDIDGSSGSDSTTILTGLYGDGYGQYANDGINIRKRKWTLVFAPLTDGTPATTAYLTAMRTFYASVGITQWFYYTPMDWVNSIDGNFVPKWRIDKDTFNPTPLNQKTWSFTFSITQCFDPGT